MGKIYDNGTDRNPTSEEQAVLDTQFLGGAVVDLN